MHTPHTLDDLLADAGVLPHDAREENEEELARSRLQLAQDYAQAQRRGTGGGFPRPALGPASLATIWPGPTGSVPRREWAARSLRSVSAWAIRSPRAADHISSLATHHQIDNPDGAFVFACLLHLADRDDQAETWWQFAAGAGKAASAECLYLLHTTRGELRQARHWEQQATDLDTPDEQPPAPAPPTLVARVLRESKPPTTLLLLRLWWALRAQDNSGGTLTISAFHAYAGTLSRTMTTAVHSLKAETADIGLISWPDHTLADQMNQCQAP